MWRCYARFILGDFPIRASQFRDGHLSLTRAARLAELPVSAFIRHLSRLGIPVVDLTSAETTQDMETLDEWLAAS